VKTYPAIAVGRPSDPDVLLAAVDDFGPIAVEERDAILRIFFSTTSDRDLAYTSLAQGHDLKSIDVPDEDWARRSQENLKAVTVGRITVAPPWSSLRHPLAISHQPSRLRSHSPVARASARQAANSDPLAISHQPSAILVVVSPSMGFGTGHHATTRLCLAALQEVDVAGRVVVDVGTGSGVLAIAADRLGAAEATGIDVDEDAVQAARENLALNPEAAHVVFAVADLESAALPVADVVTANLTGAMLERSAGRLLGSTRTGGILVLSGLMQIERDAVVRAFMPAAIVWERHEDEWVGLAVKKP
jgi:ribosomal protein L11 methyltransferase